MTGRRTVRTQRWLDRRRPLVRVVAVSLVALLGVGTMPARAQLITTAPPDLLNQFRLTASQSLYLANDAQYDALQHLQFTAHDSVVTNAIATTLAAHGLPASDALAVQSWARDDALAELWGMLVKAVNASDPTEDQFNAVHWLATLAKRQNMLAARNAGLEYVKWAGLSQSTYNSLVDAVFADPTSHDAQMNLESFLNTGFTSPKDFAFWTDDNDKIGTATEGFCVYRSPAPFQTEYQGNIFSGTDSS